MIVVTCLSVQVEFDSFSGVSACFLRSRWKPLAADVVAHDWQVLCDVMTLLGSLFRVLTASGVKVQGSLLFVTYTIIQGIISSEM